MSALRLDPRGPARDEPAGLPRVLSGLGADGARLTLARHLDVHGPLPRLAPEDIVDAVERSGLRGRGGADFPTAIKLRAVAARRRRAVVVVNGSETEPGSQKDRLLLGSLPHLVLDGAELAAEAVGSTRIILRVPGERELVSALEAAIRERGGAKVEFAISAGGAGYVTGEESAVVNFIETGRPLPRLVPPRPYERGVDGRPTLIGNPETLAQMALVARHGPEWYRQLGTQADPGSALVTIGGAVARPGVYELAFGTSMRDLLRAAGGAVEPLQALLVGGYFGTWITARKGIELRLSRAELRAAGCALGSGVLFALGQSACGLHESARLIDWLAGESAGQCGPCVHGLDAIAGAYDALAEGYAHASEAKRIAQWVEDIQGRGACHHPDGVGRLTLSALRVFGTGDGHPAARCRGRAAGLPLPARRAT
jgi:NADH:ubiquinone oxidoreductase subunit F (NADH-binding)